MGTVPDEFEDAGDNELIEAVRSGSTAAYGVLYERHSAAAHSMARQVANDPSEADDLVSEAFAKVLTGLRAGQGPNTAFRAYLLTAVRRTAYDRTRKERKLRYSADVGAEEGADVSVPFTDPAVAGLERSLAAQAFARLPERWQTVLWHLEIEGESPAEVAPVLGLTANGVSALAYRAREGLRQAYLQVHLGQLEAAEEDAEHCRAAAQRLGAWTRGGLSKRESAQVDTHLDSCTRCRALAAELGDVNGGLRLVVAPFVLGGSAAGYLAGGSGTAAAAGVTAAGGTAGAAGAATSLPRQVLGTTASTAAMVVAVALGLVADGQQPNPAAASPPPPERPVPEEPTPRPEPPAPKPPPERSPAPEPPPEPSPAPSPEPVPPRAPAPGEPNLVAAGPGQPVHLVAGGDPSDLPITIRNNGEGLSEPITAKLSLPEGIGARLPGVTNTPSSGSEAAGTGPARVTARSARTASTADPAPREETAPSTDGTGPRVGCTSAGSSLTCVSARGLRPGEELRLGFRVRADRTARSGEVAVDITSAGGLSLSLAEVRVRVKPSTDPGIVLTTDSWSGAFPWSGSRVHAHARNTGDTTGRASVVFELPEGLRAVGLPEACERTGPNVRCSAELRPGQTTEFAVWLCDSRWLAFDPLSEEELASESPTDWLRPTRIPVRAELGKAADSARISLRPWWSRLPDHWELPDSWSGTAQWTAPGAWRPGAQDHDEEPSTSPPESSRQPEPGPEPAGEPKRENDTTPTGTTDGRPEPTGEAPSEGESPADGNGSRDSGANTSPPATSDRERGSAPGPSEAPDAPAPSPSRVPEPSERPGSEESGDPGPGGLGDLLRRLLPG
ncbi:hypothetical protein CDG81_04005 [Actinopolyspora erythraea]|uniref:RNA polymerase subunit sigma n=1 Tax=Actinopolyspora erythraea TaxID=414996 RepID=A0A223RPC7_9ACTN|nr:sigma-70 family RNA polymerase sigma factor [Actinopolyspora erythraea]ASU77615.1 hypothetical protein CDG81_04005 [Actinopolyspora erythraea]